MILSERYIQLPVQLILDRPMSLDYRGKRLDRHLSRHDRVTDTDTFLAPALDVADDHADRLEPRPPITVGQSARDATHVVPSRFLAAMALVRTAPVADGHRRHLAIQDFGEKRLDPIAKRSLIPLHVEDVVAPGVDDATGDLRLAPRGINGHRGPLELHPIQQFWDRGDLVALRIDHQLPEADRVGRGPGADHVDGRFVARLVETAPECLAVDRYHLAFRGLMERLDPAQQTSLKLSRRQHREDRIEPIMRRDSRAQVENLSKPSTLHQTEVGNRNVIVGAADHRADRDDDKVYERVCNLSTTRVGKRREMDLNLGAH